LCHRTAIGSRRRRIDEAITLIITITLTITFITLTLTIITLREEGVRWLRVLLT